MKGTLHLILGTPDSGRRSILSHANTPESPQAGSHFLLPEELKDQTIPHSCWRWEEEEFRFSGSEPASPAEFFLFFSNNFDLADQFEASLSLLSSETELELGRIIVFLNSRLLVQADSSITEWIDGAVHFADALCFTHRENDNASEIAKCKERFESMRYPLETYVLGKKKAPPLERILFPSARRISHAFDPQDLLEPEDSPQNDTYLARQPNGKRQRPIPRPFASR